jgi:hypothetical protein
MSAGAGSDAGCSGGKPAILVHRAPAGAKRSASPADRPEEVQAMRNILAFLGALVVTLVVVGWYENWFQFRTTPGADGNRNITIDIDSNKVTNDVEEAEHKVQTFIDEEAKKAKSTSPAQPTKDKPAAGEWKDGGKDFELKVTGPSGKH